MEKISVRILILEMEEPNEVLTQELYSLLSKHSASQDVKRLPEKEEELVLSFPGLELHRNAQTVYSNDVRIPMSHHEFFVLYFLAQHPGWVFTKDQIYSVVWQTPNGNSNAAVTNIISQIRKKLNPNNPKNTCIKTVVHGGYKFEI